MNTEQLFNFTRLIFSRFLKTTVVTVLCWICVYAIPYMEPIMISDKLISDVYLSGRTTQKVSYEDVEKQSNKTLFNEEEALQNYYSTYIDQIEKNQQRTSDELEKKIREPLKQVNVDERSSFLKSIYEIYGNSTVFNVDLGDLEKLVNTSAFSDGQAVIFWESLLHHKTDRTKLIYGHTNNEPDNEFYLFNFIPLKTIGMIFLSIVIFLFVHNVQIYLTKIHKATFFFNLLSMAGSLYTVDLFFNWKYYLASSIIFFQFCLAIKYGLDSILVHLGYHRDDMDTFINIKTTKNLTQFTLKMFIYLALTVLIGALSFAKYKYILNYILFYLCLIQSLFLFSFFIQQEVSQIFQPLKHFSMIFIGVLNFLLTKFHKPILSHTRINQSYDKIDSFYLISDVFSFICISSIYDYLNIQANHIQRKFSKDESLWIMIFIIGILMGFIGLCSNSYLTFYFSIYYIRLILKVFGRYFRVKLMRVVYCYMILLLLLENHIMSSKNDSNLFEIFGVSTGQIISFLKFICRTYGVLYIYVIVYLNFEFIYMLDSKKGDIEDSEDNNADQLIKKIEITSTEKKKKKKFKTIEIQVIKQEDKKFSFSNIIFIHFDIYTNYTIIILLFFLMRDVEKNYIILTFYAFLALLMVIRVKIIFND